MSQIEHPPGAVIWGLLPQSIKDLQEDRGFVLFSLSSQGVAQGLAHSKCSVHTDGLVIHISTYTWGNRGSHRIIDHPASGHTLVQDQISELEMRHNDSQEKQIMSRNCSSSDLGTTCYPRAVSTCYQNLVWGSPGFNSPWDTSDPTLSGCFFFSLVLLRPRY